MVYNIGTICRGVTIISLSNTKATRFFTIFIGFWFALEWYCICLSDSKLEWLLHSYAILGNKVISIPCFSENLKPNINFWRIKIFCKLGHKLQILESSYFYLLNTYSLIFWLVIFRYHKIRTVVVIILQQ